MSGASHVGVMWVKFHIDRSMSYGARAVKVKCWRKKNRKASCKTL